MQKSSVSSLDFAMMAQFGFVIRYTRLRQIYVSMYAYMTHKTYEPANIHSMPLSTSQSDICCWQGSSKVFFLSFLNTSTQGRVVSLQRCECTGSYRDSKTVLWMNIKEQWRQTIVHRFLSKNDSRLRCQNHFLHDSMIQALPSWLDSERGGSALQVPHLALSMAILPWALPGTLQNISMILFLFRCCRDLVWPQAW